MKRRILLVDDDVAVLLTFKAVLEISGFDVDTAASAREGKSRIRSREYHMVISDMRMESDVAGREVIQAARTAPYHPAVALLTAFPDDDAGWDGAGPDKVLIKATQTRILLQQIEKLFNSHSAKLAKLAAQSAGTSAVANGAATEKASSGTELHGNDDAEASPSQADIPENTGKIGQVGLRTRAQEAPISLNPRNRLGSLTSLSVPGQMSGELRSSPVPSVLHHPACGASLRQEPSTPTY